MLSDDYLTLRLVRLKSPDFWAHDRAELGFVFPRGGSGLLAPGPAENRLSPGDVLVLNGPSQSRISVTGASEIVFWFFAANLEHLFPLFGCDEVCKLRVVTEGFKSPRFYRASSPLAIECHKLLSDVPPRFDLDHRGQLLRVVAGILSVEFKNVQPQHSGSGSVDEHVSRLFEQLSMSEMLTLSIGELAARFNCGRRHLNRLFHQHFGLSVSALRMEMRLLKAVSLLRDPSIKIINVAEQCGFNHLGLFNTCFKRRFRATPGDWRKLPASSQPKAPPPADVGSDCRLRANGLCPWASSLTTDGAPLCGPKEAKAPEAPAANRRALRKSRERSKTRNLSPAGESQPGARFRITS